MKIVWMPWKLIICIAYSCSSLVYDYPDIVMFSQGGIRRIYILYNDKTRVQLDTSNLLMHISLYKVYDTLDHIFHFLSK